MKRACGLAWATLARVDMVARAPAPVLPAGREQVIASRGDDSADVLRQWIEAPDAPRETART